MEEEEVALSRGYGQGEWDTVVFSGDSECTIQLHGSNTVWEVYQTTRRVC